MPEAIAHAVDYLTFLGYSVLLWQALSSWNDLRKISDKRKESTLTALLMVMVISILAFVGANAYMLQYRGETLLTMRIFQIFVIANLLVYWITLAHLRKEVANGSPT